MVSRPSYARLGRLAAAAWLACAGSAQSRPLTLADLWRLEAVQGARAVAAGRRLLLETAAPYADAGQFDDLALILLERSRLSLIDPKLKRPRARPLAPGAGVVPLALSPSGDRLALGRIEHRALKLGVANMLTGRVRWTGLDVRAPRNGASVGWIDDHALVALAPLGPPSETTFPTSAPAQTALARARRAQAAGRLPASRVYGSGAFAIPPPADTRVIFVDLRLGARRTLAVGAFDDLETAPGGRFAAVSGPAEPPPLAALTSVTIADVMPRRRLQLIDLATGRVTRPCPGCDLAPTLLAWSDDGARLLTYVRSDTDHGWATGRYMVVDAARGETRALAPDGWTPDVPLLPATFYPVVQGGWEGGAPVLRLSSPARPKPALYRLETSGPQPTRFTPTSRLGGGDRAQVVPDPGRLHAREPTGPDGLVLVQTAQARLVEHRDPHGVMRVVLERGGRRDPVVDINSHLGDVEPVEPRLLTRVASTGATVVDRLYLPARAGAGDARAPLIVSPYPGANAPRQPESERPGSPPPEINPQLLVARGYAVLIPALPRLKDDEPADRTPTDIEAALDGAVATGLVDPDRAALWGQSFGGFTVLSVAARTSRFRAVIAQAAPTDLVSLYGTFSAATRGRPEGVLVRDGMLGYVEAGQGGMGAPPWRDAAKYLRNSPVFDVERIAAPVLMVDGDQDFFDVPQKEEMFSALRRLDKSAQLLVFPGENHTFMSPPVQKAYLDAALTFLDRTLSSKFPSTARASATTNRPPRSPPPGG